MGTGVDIIGIDPGVGGGMCQMSWEGTVFALTKMPETEADIAEWIREKAPLCKAAYLEKVHSMPKQGVASTFTFGKNYGFLRGALITAGIPVIDVTPQKWMKALGIGVRTADMSKADGKRQLKALAQQWYPTLMKEITLKTCDALLIARYGRMEQLGYHDGRREA